MSKTEYLIPQSPDDRVLKRAASLLADGGMIAIPSDTNWLACVSPFSKKGIERFYALKKEENKKHFSLICRDISMAATIALIDDSDYRQIRNIVPGHYTFVFPAMKKIAKVLKASKMDKQVGIRIPPTPLLHALMEHCDFPLLSTQLTQSLLELDEGLPVYGALIEDQMGHALDLILDPGEYDFAGPSTVVDFTTGEGPVVIRRGAGTGDHFPEEG